MTERAKHELNPTIGRCRTCGLSADRIVEVQRTTASVCSNRAVAFESAPEGRTWTAELRRL